MNSAAVLLFNSKMMGLKQLCGFPLNIAVLGFVLFHFFSQKETKLCTAISKRKQHPCHEPRVLLYILPHNILF